MTKKKIAPEEKKRKRIQRRFKGDINTAFTNAAFTQVPTRGKEFNFRNRRVELDNIYVYKNIIVICEDTTLNNGLKDHLNNKAELFNFLNKERNLFIEKLEEEFPRFKKVKTDQFSPQDCKLVFLYCALNKIEKRYKDRHPHVLFLDYKELQYFLKLSRTIAYSSRFEILKFLNLDLKDVGLTSAGLPCDQFDGFLLPESPSGYPKGFKLVTFLIEPQRLLEQSYVLRKDSWRDIECLYQRLLIQSKIKQMREYLVAEKRVFVNNIIVTLPSTTNLIDPSTDKQLEAAEIDKKRNVSVLINREFNSFGIIDGQHRIYSYHERKDKLDKDIATLRNKQHLLLTGIIYPDGISELEKTKFEAQLFLEINDKQTKTKADLKQAIEMLVNPFSSIAVSKQVLVKLSNDGPLCGYLEEHFFDRGKIKTSSIVSYGLMHLVKFEGEDSLYTIWKGRNKSQLKAGKNRKALESYVDFCANQINEFLIGFKKNIPSDLWSSEKKISRVLTTTTINGLIYCMRRLVQERRLGNSQFYEEKLKENKVNFTPQGFKFKSSHWKGLGDKIYTDCFENK